MKTSFRLCAKSKLNCDSVFADYEESDFNKQSEVMEMIALYRHFAAVEYKIVSLMDGEVVGESEWRLEEEEESRKRDLRLKREEHDRIKNLSR